MSERIYRSLLHLYPKPFRDEYGPALLQLFRDRFREEPGLLAHIRLWLDLIADLARSIPSEHLRTPRANVDTGRYCLSEKALTAMFRRTALAPVVLFYLFAVLGFIIARVANASPHLLLIVFSTLGIAGITKLRGIGKFKQRWRTFEVVIEAECIQQNRCGRKLALHRTAVAEIIEEDPGLTILTSGADAMFIPSRLNGYEDIRRRLGNWMPVKRYAAPSGDNPLLLTSGALPLVAAMLLVPIGIWFFVLGTIYILCVLPVFFGLRPIDTERYPRRRIARSERPASVQSCRSDGVIVKRHVPMDWFGFLALSILPVVKCIVPLAGRALR